MKQSNILLISLLCACSFGAVAKQGDLQQELKIEAVSQKADIKNNQIIFFGPVKVVQGSIHIHANELRAFTPKNTTGTVMLAIGNPATFSQDLDDGSTGTASAKEIRYDLATLTLTLSGDAKLDQAGSQVTGNRIRYNIKDQQLIAESTGTGTDRVITIIQPENYQASDTKASLPEIPIKKQDIE
jgi:lipopolysaccharide export system protein LptA